MSRDAELSASCAHCGCPAKGGGYGGFDLAGSYQTYCSPECRTAHLLAEKAAVEFPPHQDEVPGEC